MTDHVKVSDDGAVRTVRLNRPEKKNALTGEMYLAIADSIEDAADDDALRCLLIAGTADDFCAGNDLADFLKASEQDGTLGAPVIRFLDVLAHCETPLVAAVQGNAVGVGTTMLFHCDYVVASTQARFSAPFVHLGVTPEAGSTLLAPRMMGHVRAFSLLAMGRPMSAEEAKAAGLVNQIVPPHAVDAEAAKAAQEIAALPRQSLHAARNLLRGAREDVVARVNEENIVFQARLGSDEARAALKRFFSRK